MASQATRFPKKLAKKIPLELIQKGVYTINCGTDKIRLIVLSEIPKIKQNAFWCWHWFSLILAI